MIFGRLSKIIRSKRKLLDDSTKVLLFFDFLVNYCLTAAHFKGHSSGSCTNRYAGCLRLRNSRSILSTTTASISLARTSAMSCRRRHSCRSSREGLRIRGGSGESGGEREWGIARGRKRRSARGAEIEGVGAWAWFSWIPPGEGRGKVIF